MDAGKLVKMANQIASFFAADPDRNAAVAAVASHLRRFWEPRMRAAILQQLDREGTAGMHELVAEALRQHRAQLAPVGG
jgi:formate dehydrogenase subunit delta